ncbi:2-dehydropantoate 2-reductase [Persephonella sp.]|uniref:ketopantoate reductase family protein n=1 Tax=Persephonella sp. TaxID=2060922 RepID=UPI0025FC4F25|nr:2-dehydropantoate 2-reductase [Persephonella sp.]
MNIAVVGLGALGIAFATFLKNSGNTVFGITKEKYLKNFEKNTVRVKGIWGDHTANLDGIYSDPSQIKENINLVILTVKSYDTEKALNQIKPIVGKETLILIAQNGYGNYEKAVEIFGKDKVLLSRVIFGSKIVDKNSVEITVSADDVRIGDPSKTIPEKKVLNIVETIRKSGIPTSFASDVYQILWDKILYNCALNPLGALLECSYGDLAENKYTRQIMESIIKEIFLVTKANDIKLRWENPEEYIKHFYQNLIPPTKKHFPSMFYDLKSGKKTEIDALNGAIIKLAQKKGIKAQTNETITLLIKFKESNPV